MPSFQINDEEWGAFYGEHSDLFRVYCAIRRYMNYRTGVSGLERRISEQMLSETLYIEPLRGRHKSGSPTRQHVRSLLSRLITKGIMVQVGPMVYELPLATRDSSFKSSATNEQPDQQPDQQPINNHDELSNGAGFSADESLSATGSESANFLISNLPPDTGTTPPPSGRAPKRFAMHPEWQPDPKTFKAVLHMNGLTSVTLDADVLLEFRSFWTASPDEHRTQAKWEHALAQRLKENYRNGQSQTSKPSAGQRTGKKGASSAVDRVKRNIANRQAAEAGADSAGQALAEDDGDVWNTLDGECRRLP
jgi:hypothetical protein